MPAASSMKRMELSEAWLSASKVSASRFTAEEMLRSAAL